MLGGLGDMMGMLKQVKEFQSRMGEIQAALEASRFTADAGAGAVTVTVDGKGTVVDVRISLSATGDVELLEDLVKASVCAAVRKAQEAMQSEMSKLTGGLNIPGLSAMLGGQ
jgi:DNA-binding YbaB/EbfC family protein